MEMVQLVGIGLAYVLLGVIVLLLAKVTWDAVTPFQMASELTEKDNPAVGLSLAGYYLGVVIIFLGAVIGPAPERLLTAGEIALMLAIDFAYAIVGIGLLIVGRWTVDKFVLYQFSTVKEIVEDRNAGTGAVECGCLIATALVVAGAVSGETAGAWWTGPLATLVYFLLGQVVLILFARFYQRITKYDIHAEIERDNVAAGAALGFSVVAMGIIVLKALTSDLDTWQETLAWFILDAGIGFLLLMLLRKITDALFLPGTTIQHEIAQDQNLNAAWIEGVLAIGIAAIIFFVV